ncbi:MAG TPA: ChrR family anti-sigma-E factor [Roseiarcus sp.]
MTVHHPSDLTLARLAAGTLGAGPRLVVATHLSGCPECRRGLRSFEGVGGAMLEAAPPTRLSPDAFAQVLKRLDEPDPPAELTPRVVHPDLPPPLNACEIGPWRFVRPGFRWRRLTLPDSPDANVIMLRVAAGQPVPHHGHTGSEYTQVLTGSFSDSLGRYRAGDCVELDEEVNHQPIVDQDGECICLAAVEGRLRLSGWIGRLIQPLIGI